MGKSSKNNRKERSTAYKIITRIIISLIIAAVITALSVFVPVKISTPSDVDDMNFGKPVAFLNQNAGVVVREEFLPVYAFLQFNCLEDRTVISVPNFFVSLGINFAAVLVVVFAVFIIKQARKTKKTKTNRKEEAL